MDLGYPQVLSVLTHAGMRARSHTHAFRKPRMHARTHTRTHARTHAHTHTHALNSTHALNPKLYTLHPAPYTLNPKSYTLNPKP